MASSVLLPAWALWLPNTAWKLFDLFIGFIQALIFVFLTIEQIFGPSVSADGH